MNASHRSSNTNSPLATPPPIATEENACVSSVSSEVSSNSLNKKSQEANTSLPSDLFDINQNFTLTAEAFDNVRTFYPNTEIAKSAVILNSSLGFAISNPNLFPNNDILNNNLTIPSPKNKFTGNSPLPSNTSLENFDFDWQNASFLTNFLDAENESRFDSLSDINTPFVEDNLTNDINSFITEFQETDVISSQARGLLSTNDLDVLDSMIGTSNSKRPYANIIDDQSPSSVSTVNKRQKQLNINRRKSNPAVDTIVNSFNRTLMSQTDTITYDTKTLSEKTAIEVIPVKVEDDPSQSTTTSTSILCINRHEFFHQMNTRLSTLAQFIKQSFRQQTDYTDLWDQKLYPLLRFECQQIQRLIDLTDFKSLNIPKNLGQYSEYDIEKDVTKFIPEHVADYKFPLKVQRDGNEGFRAVSALLNDNLINRGANNREQLHEELRVRVVLEMVNRIEKNRRIFEKHTEEISANGGNITTTSVYEGYFQKDTIGLLSHFGLSTNAPQYASVIWQIESLNTCINGTLMGVPQLCILANILKATIRIIYPDKENRYFNAPIKCKGSSRRMLHFLVYNPLYKLQFSEPPIEQYYVAPLVRQSDIL